MRRIRIDVAYDGTDFAGWQFQPGQRTVQGVLEATLGEIEGGRPVRLRGAGRTDAGVHARGQVADAVFQGRLGDEDLRHALCRMLPVDVRPLRVTTVPESFHAQFDARGKEYRYRLDLSPHGDPLSVRYALHHPQALDEDRVLAALSALPGRRDWSGFTSDACDKEDRVRGLSVARYDRVGDDVACFTFAADGFLRYMVRTLVGTVLLIGRGGMDVERIGRILSSGDRDLAGPTAPPHGLCLERVRYRDGAAPSPSSSSRNC